MRILPILILLGCGGAAPSQVTVATSPMGEDARAAAEAAKKPAKLRADTPLQWTPQGKLIVGGRWSLDPEGGRFAPIREGKDARVLISPKGKLARVEGQTLHIGELAVAVPSWLKSGEPRTTAYWADEQRIYVHQVESPGADSACRIYDLAKKAFTVVAPCLEGDFHDLYWIQRGPGDLLAVYSAGEGHPGVLLTRFTPGGPQKNFAFSVDLYPFGPLEVAFLKSGALMLLSPCQLGAAERPCAGIPDTAPTGAYRLSAEGELSKRIMNVPLGAATAWDGKRLAWGQGDEVCVSTPSDPKSKRCFTLP